MKNILVSGASGVVGYGVLKSLRKYNDEFHLVGTTIYDDSVAPAFCDVFEQAPLSSDEGYVAWLCSTIAKHKIDLIIPGIDIDMQVWNTARHEIEKTGAVALLNTEDLITLCSDKWDFYQKLVQNGSPYAIESRLTGGFSELSSDLGLPFLFKPRRGFASKGIVIVDSEEVFKVHEKDLGLVVMAQPIIGNNDEEYTISAFFDSQSKLCCYMGLQRKLAKEGYTEKARTIDVPGAKEAMEQLAAITSPVGPTNFQFRLHNGQLKLLEINPRISSATSIRTEFGYNESKIAADYFLEDILPSQPSIKPGYAVRYIDEKVFYDSNSV